MNVFRPRQPWLTGRGPGLQVADVVPDTPPLRPWADRVPWAALVAAVDRSWAQRLPKLTTRGRPPVATRVFWAVALLHQEVGGSDEQRSSRLRTALAVLSAGGITAVQGARAQASCVLPAGRAQFRRRLDAPLLKDLLALQAATAMAEGLVRPAPVVVAPVPREPGSPRVKAAATL